jgi:predicted acetyltransferase
VVTDGPVVRELAEDDLPAAWELGRLAFGGPPGPPPPDMQAPAPGLTRYGTFDPSGRLVGKVVDLHHDQWWGGRLVPAADVAGVAVAPEARGRGLARALLTALLAGARERGAAVSALYPTVSAVYRASGWAMVGTRRTFDLPTAGLAGFPPGPAVVRAAGPDDLPAVADLSTQVARAANGLLDRRGPLFADGPGESGLGPGVDGITLVEEAGALVGAAVWTRGRGYGAGAVLEVEDLLAVTPGAARELVGVLAGWRTVTPTVRVSPQAADVVALALPMELATEQRATAWMHRPVDVARAVAARGWSGRGRAVFFLRDLAAPWNHGAWELTVADGEGRLERTGVVPDVHLDVAGFALLYAGVASPAMLVHAGLLHAPGADLSGLAALVDGPPAALTDYF